MNEALLPALGSPSRPPTPLQIPVKPARYAFDTAVLVLWLVGLAAMVGITLRTVMTGAHFDTPLEVILTLFAVVGAPICIWQLRTLHRIRELAREPGATIFTLDADGVRVPVHLLSGLHQYQAVDQGLPRLFVPWSDIERWGVEPGDTDAEPTYELTLSRHPKGMLHRRLDIIRRDLRYREAQILEYVRTVGNRDVVLRKDAPDRDLIWPE